MYVFCIEGISETYTKHQWLGQHDDDHSAQSYKAKKKQNTIVFRSKIARSGFISESLYL